MNVSLKCLSVSISTYNLINLPLQERAINYALPPLNPRNLCEPYWNEINIIIWNYFSNW